MIQLSTWRRGGSLLISTVEMSWLRLYKQWSDYNNWELSVKLDLIKLGLDNIEWTKIQSFKRG